jgi:hypothetical protein
VDRFIPSADCLQKKTKIKNQFKMKKLVQLSALVIAFVLTANITKSQDIISAKDYAVLAKKDKNVVTVFAGKEKKL